MSYKQVDIEFRGVYYTLGIYIKENEVLSIHELDSCEIIPLESSLGNEIVMFVKAQ